MGYDGYKCRLINPLSVKSYNTSFNKDDLIPPASAAIARFVSQTSIAPLELLRTKMQSKKLSYLEVKTMTLSAIKQVLMLKFY